MLSFGLRYRELQTDQLLVMFYCKLFRTVRVRVRIQLLDFSSTLAIEFLLVFDLSFKISNSNVEVYLLKSSCQKSDRIVTNYIF